MQAEPNGKGTGSSLTIPLQDGCDYSVEEVLDQIWDEDLAASHRKAKTKSAPRQPNGATGPSAWPMPNGREGVQRPVGGGSASADVGATRRQADGMSDEAQREVQMFYIGGSDGNNNALSVETDKIKHLEEKLAMSEVMNQNALSLIHI